MTPPLQFSGFWYILAIATDTQGLMPVKEHTKLGALVLAVCQRDQLKMTLALSRWARGRWGPFCG